MSIILYLAEASCEFLYAVKTSFKIFLFGTGPIIPVFSDLSKSIDLSLIKRHKKIEYLVTLEEILGSLLFGLFLLSVGKIILT